MSWKHFPRIYTNLQSSLTACMSYFIRNEKSLPKYLINEKFKMSAFFISEKTAPQMDKFFNFLPYIQRIAISVSQS